MIQMIPARNCILSPKNVRRTPVDAAIADQFKADVAARGVLQNLIGFALPKKRGKFEITAGGRRLAAVHALIDDGALAADYQIPVLVMNDTSVAAETSLAENFQRLAMNPADECVAFRHFIDGEGKSIEDVASRFGLTTRFVEGRIRLAGLSDEVFEALQNGEISLEVAQAFGTTSDVARQSAVFAQMKGGYFGFQAANIRRAMINEAVTGSSTPAKLVGHDAYLAAGGRIETDLFAAQAEENWLDTGIVRTLAEAKIAEAAAQVTGFANVVPVLAARPGYDLTGSLRPLQGVHVALTENEAARFAEIEAEIEAMEVDSDEVDDEDAAATFDVRYEALRAEAERLTNRVAEIDDATRATATAFVVVGPDGTPTLYETIYVEPAAGDAPANGGGADRLAGAAGAHELGKPIRDELAVVRTKLLALHVANDPGFAVDLMVFQLADAQVKPGTSTERGSSLHGGSPGRAAFGFTPEGPVIDAMATFAERLDYSWADYRTAADRFDAFRALDDDRRGGWAGWTMAKTLEPKLADEPQAAFHNHLGRSLGIDVAAWWRPTAKNYFTRVRKGVVLAALAAIGGNDLKNRYAAAKKGDLAEAAEKLCAGTSIVEAKIRAAAVAWVPHAMTFGTVGETEVAVDRDDLVDDAAPSGGDDAGDDDRDHVDPSAASREEALEDAA